MAFNVSEFRTALGSGVRPNLFRVKVSGGLTVDGATNSVAEAMVKSAALPGSTIGLVEVPHYGGRRLKLAGDRTFAEWTMTVINDDAFKARDAFVNFQKLFVSTDYNTTTIGARASTALCTVEVHQLDSIGDTIIKKYKLQNAFISDISALDLSYDSTDTISEFTVTWVYDFYTTGATAGGEASAEETV